MLSNKGKDTLLLLGRILISIIFIVQGYTKFGNVDAIANAAGLANWQIITAAVVELIGGLLILLGGCIHLGALALAVYLAVATYMLHLPNTPFADTVQVYKNLALIGSMLVLLASGGGKYQIYQCKCDK